MSEAEWMQQVRDLAHMFGWATYHTHDSRRSEPGFPDLVLCRPPNLLFVELKTDKGRPTDEQISWELRLVASGQRYEVWRPRDIDHVKATLGRHK